MTNPSIQSLRVHAVSQSLFNPTTLKDAIERLKFIQADPIRSPARAQDLILRQRVQGYRAGDLEHNYPTLDLEEDVLYAYGFLAKDIGGLLHPRKLAEALNPFEEKVLETVGRFGETHPAQLEAHFGRERVINAWGGYSKATTRTLERLHHRGHLRIARREKGIRIYQLAAPYSSPLHSAANAQSLTTTERVKKLMLVIVNIFAPVGERCLQEAFGLVRRSLPEPVNTKSLVAELVKSGELEKQAIDGINYFIPAGSLTSGEIPRQVRFLAPFDPLVWDRRRFEHLWNWAYRFEAYTPAVKRVRGYYAMPLLWEENVIGWVNISVQKGNLNVEPGFVEKRPTDSSFSVEFEKEIAHMKNFLGLI